MSVPGRIALPAVAALLFLLLPAGPAAAHGAPTSPLSRAAACAPQGKHVGSPACAAAIAAAGGGALDWDNIRVADVDGRDRQVIPDGRLCSAGIDRFKGLDTPRADWPVTQLQAGAAITVRYEGTIPHKGAFRLYLTKPGYDPARPLRWSDLDQTPFLTAKDPPLTKGAYVMTGRLPQGRTGRHLIYTVWQTSSTPDTYYSCSDVVFGGGAGTAGSPPASGGSAATAASGSAAFAPGAAEGQPLARTSTDRGVLPFAAAGAVAVLALAVLAVFAMRRRARLGGAHRG